MQPRVLLVTTNRWFASAQLALTLQRTGVSVDAVAPPGHPIKETSACGRFFPYHGLFPLRTFRTGIEAAKPDVVVPCDDLARAILHRLHSWAVRQGASAEGLKLLLERSLGDPANYALIASRSPLIQLAQEEGILAPDTGVVRSLEELQAWIALHGLPVILKTDGTSGGRGVRSAMTLKEAEGAFTLLDSPPEIARTIKRAVADQDWSLVIPCLQRHHPLISVQKFVAGRDATIAIACWQGRLLASIAVEVLKTWKVKGPASVIRIIDNPAITTAAEKLAGRLGLSGLCGFDFVLADTGGAAHLIEMNPRATQTAHLPLGTGRNLPAALGAAIVGEEPPKTTGVTEKEVIALFPSEWLNDSASPWLQSAYHDVPWGEPKLVRLGVKSKLANGGWLTYENLNRLLERFFGRRS